MFTFCFINTAVLLSAMLIGGKKGKERATIFSWNNVPRSTCFPLLTAIQSVDA